jgi:hypothetical protein
MKNLSNELNKTKKKKGKIVFKKKIILNISLIFIFFKLKIKI